MMKHWEAPAEWGLPKQAPLDQAAVVLSQRIGEQIDDSSPPSLMPDRGFVHGSVWHNVWLMGDELGWSHFVDCRYHRSERIVRLKADGLKQCQQMAPPYSARGGPRGSDDGGRLAGVPAWLNVSASLARR